MMPSLCFVGTEDEIGTIFEVGKIVLAIILGDDEEEDGRKLGRFVGDNLFFIGSAVGDLVIGATEGRLVG